MPDPGLMPLPDAAADLDWSNLVDAAKAYEGEFSGDRAVGLGRTRAMLPCECWPVSATLCPPSLAQPGPAGLLLGAQQGLTSSDSIRWSLMCSLQRNS